RQQALGHGFSSVEHPAFEQNFQRDRAPNQGKQTTHFPRRHGKAQTVDRHPEARGGRGDAKVALAGDLEPPSYTYAFDLGQYRMNTRSNGIQGGSKDLGVV